VARTLVALAVLVLWAHAQDATVPPTLPASRPTARGSADLLSRILEDHVKARHENTKASLAAAEKLDRRLLDHDWSGVDVPQVTLGFALAKEAQVQVRGRRQGSWDYDRLPPQLAKIATPGQWSTFVDRQLDHLIDHAGSVSWRSPKARRSAASDLLLARAFEKIASHLATHLAESVTSIPPADLARFTNALFRVYEEYDIETVQRSSLYGYLPAGVYLQWGGWLADGRAFRIATSMIDAWLADPRSSREDNLLHAVRTVDLFNTRLNPAVESQRAAMIARVKADPRIPESIKKLIRSVP
jgi:hypothetical protein